MFFSSEAPRLVEEAPVQADVRAHVEKHVLAAVAEARLVRPPDRPHARLGLAVLLAEGVARRLDVLQIRQGARRE